MSDCNTCTWQNNDDACAFGASFDDDDEPCPGYQNTICSECMCNPCVCKEFDDA